MVNFVEGFGPVSQEVDDCCGLVWIVCIAEDEVNDGEQGMGARSTRN